MGTQAHYLLFSARELYPTVSLRTPLENLSWVDGTRFSGAMPALRFTIDGAEPFEWCDYVRPAANIPLFSPLMRTALEQAGVELLHAATLGDALRALRAHHIRSILIEGGAALAASLIQEALVDRLIIFRAPLVLGTGALNPFSAFPPVTIEDAPRWRLVRSVRAGDDEMTVYAPPAGEAGAS